MTSQFGVWVSGHYDNGETPDKYRYDYLPSPPPTITILTQEERDGTLHPVPGDPRGGSDYTLMLGGGQSGVFVELRKNALRLPPANAQSLGDPWRDVEVRHLWCDRSPSLMPWAEVNMRRILNEETKAGIALRNVTFFRVRGANHFVSYAQTIGGTCVVDFLDRFTGRSRSEQWRLSWRLPQMMLLGSVPSYEDKR